MNIELLVVGKTDSKEVEALVELYARRVNRYCRFAVTALPDVRNTRSLTQNQQRTAEGEAILRQLAAGDHVVLLDERGDEVVEKAVGAVGCETLETVVDLHLGHRDDAAQDAFQPQTRED